MHGHYETNVAHCLKAGEQPSLGSQTFGGHCANATLAGTGNVWVNTGDERLDVGLCVKHGPNSLCVPDYVQVQPDNTGWTYSQALVAIITQYKVTAVTPFAFPMSASYANDANGVLHVQHSWLIAQGNTNIMMVSRPSHLAKLEQRGGTIDICIIYQDMYSRQSGHDVTLCWSADSAQLGLCNA